MLTPLNPILYSKTVVYRGMHYFSYICSKTRRSGYDEYPTIYGLSRNMKNITVFFLSENFQFSEVKFSKYLNRRVFVIDSRINPLYLFKYIIYIL